MSSLQQQVKKLAKRVLPADAYRKLMKSWRRNKYEKTSKLAIASGQPVFTMVVACYNVGLYLDAFFESIKAQKFDISKLQIVAVDDASTDDTLAVLERWRSELPEILEVVAQPSNQGVSAARNAGLAKVRGLWVSFPDSDDFFNANYLSSSASRIEQLSDRPLLAVTCKPVFYFEAEERYSDTHPLTYRFKTKKQTFRVQELTDNFLLMSTTTWFRAATLSNTDIQFDTELQIAEDAKFVTDLFLQNPTAWISFNAEAEYFYRKRVDDDSALGTHRNSPASLITPFERFHLPMIEKAKQLNGSVPIWMQNMVLYDLMWKIRLFQSGKDIGLSAEEQSKALSYIKSVLRELDVPVMENFSIIATSFETKFLMIRSLAEKEMTNSRVYLTLNRSDAVRIMHFSNGPEPEISFSKEKKPSVSFAHKSRDISFLGERAYTKHFDWQRLQSYESLSLENSQGVTTRICRRDGSVISENTLQGLELAGLETRPSLKAINPNIGAKELALLTGEQAKFAGGWVFMDNPNRAGDNAEALYEYVVKHRDATKCFFVLEKDSPDWDRLKAKGFNMIPYLSHQHLAALLGARALISSHIDLVVHAPAPFKKFASGYRFKFIFLQHGVIKDDLSAWLNTKKIDLFIASTPAEYESFVADGTNYDLSTADVALTGLPRFDVLRDRFDPTAVEKQPDTILVAPTWRLNLIDTSKGQIERRLVADFEKTKFFKTWKAFLENEELQRVALQRNLRIVFVPHPAFADSCELFAQIPNVKVINPREEASYTKWIKRAITFVTDYSSVAFDVAYLDRPVVYLQFDQAEFFGGAHSYTKGYFDYTQDGFGPVALNVAKATKAVIEAAVGNEPSEYSMRRKTTFYVPMDSHCARVLHEIERIVEAV